MVMPCTNTVQYTTAMVVVTNMGAWGTIWERQCGVTSEHSRIPFVAINPRLWECRMPNRTCNLPSDSFIRTPPSPDPNSLIGATQKPLSSTLREFIRMVPQESDCNWALHLLQKGTFLRVTNALWVSCCIGEIVPVSIAEIAEIFRTVWKHTLVLMRRAECPNFWRQQQGQDSGHNGPAADIQGNGVDDLLLWPLDDGLPKTLDNWAWTLWEELPFFWTLLEEHPDLTWNISSHNEVLRQP